MLKDIGSSAIRLCFDVILISGELCKPVISDPIICRNSPFILNQNILGISKPIRKRNKRLPELKIHQISAKNASVVGGECIMIFCEKVQKENIRIIFSEEDSDWKRAVLPDKVHYSYGISFQTPPYQDLRIYDVKNVFIKLYRLSDQECSNSIPFEYLPVENCKYTK